jgi:N-sulfoglucosamine sulfohydrolase
MIAISMKLSMNRIQTVLVIIFVAITILLVSVCDRKQDQVFRDEDLGFRPNILWITCEDMSPHLGCYGDSLAKTPNLDQLAQEGILFTNVYSVSGVCAPSRAAIITGLYPTSFGAQHMRTLARTASIDKVTDPEALAIPVYEAVPPPDVKCFPEYLRAAGYYCTNNHKTDYQFHPPLTVWDENSSKAHWKNRKPGQPFFAVFNIEITHESQIWQRADDPLITDPKTVPVPPYYPDSPVVRRDLARMYDNITLMDQQVGKFLAELGSVGLRDSTVIFFYSDHGDGTPRAKRWVYDSGIHVPLIVRFPGKEGAGKIVDEMISFIDLAPTVLSLAGISIPDYMHGRAFLGNQEGKEPEFIFAARDRMDPAIDNMRAVRDKRYKYIRNYLPERPYVQFIPYRDQMALMQELFKFERENKLDDVQKIWFSKTKPEEELYDLKNDPYEIKNLATDPEYINILKRMREAHEQWKIKFDPYSLIPESDLVKLLWPPDGVQPVTEPVQFSMENNILYLFCDTRGASIAYQLSSQNNKDRWQLYSSPVDFEKGDTLKAVTIRIGYKQSPVNTYY